MSTVPPGPLGYPDVPVTHDPMAVRQAVYNERVWTALIVDANAIALLIWAVETSEHSYNPMGTT